MKISLNQKYMLLQGSFWMLYCVATGFISLCLQSRGLSNQGIGFVTAVFGTISAFLQPFLGNICDRCIFLTWKKMILFLAFPFGGICVFMSFSSNTYLGIFFVGLLLLLGNTIMPFINSALSSYKFNGKNINFGLARGIGSGMYALLATIIGNLAASYGSNAVSFCGIIISLLFILIVNFMPYMEHRDTNVKSKKAKQNGFIKRYPAFIIMYIAFIFLFTSHNLVGTYLLQLLQSLGGTSREFGIAIAIQAIIEVPVLFTFSLLIKKIKVHSLMLVSAFGYVIKAIWYALAGSIMTIYLVQFTQIISFALFASASVYYTLEVIKKEDQITGQTLMTSVMAIGTVVGSLLGGWLLDHYEMKSLLIINIFISTTGILLAICSSKIRKHTMINLKTIY